MSEKLHTSTVELQQLQQRLEMEIADEIEAGPAPASLSMAIVACRLLVTRSRHDGRASLASWLEQLGRVLAWLQTRSGLVSENVLPRLKDLSAGLEKVLRGLDGGRSLSYLAGDPFIAESERCLRDVLRPLLPSIGPAATETSPAHVDPVPAEPVPPAPRTGPGPDAAPTTSRETPVMRLAEGLRRAMACADEVDWNRLDAEERSELRRRWVSVRKRCDRLIGGVEGRVETPESAAAETPDTVLLVVGSLFRAARLRRCLQQAGRRVVECTGADEALTLLESSASSLAAVLCDNVEPAANLRRMVDGLAVHEPGARPPLIMVTTSDSPHVARRARAVGADGCWPAPFAPLVLDAEVASAVSAKASERAK